MGELVVVAGLEEFCGEKVIIKSKCVCMPKLLLFASTCLPIAMFLAFPLAPSDLGVHS